jgi:hypothetical protein
MNFLLYFLFGLVVSQARGFNFIPYGTADGDSQCQKSTDYECMNVNLGITFKLRHLFSFSSLNVLSNGCLSYDETEHSNFTACAFPNEFNYALGGNVFYRSTGEQSVLDLVDSQIIEGYYNKQARFSSTRVFVATWANVVEDGTSNRNTFQVILAVDSISNSHFIVFNYGKCESEMPIKCGFTWNATHSQSLVNCGPASSNVGQAGLFVFLVNGDDRTSMVVSSTFSIKTKEKSLYIFLIYLDTATIS